jgi:hypothetical protein
MDNQAITITFGDRAENHVGMQQIGTLSDKGFNLDDLIRFKNYFDEFEDVTSTIYNLKELAGLTDNDDVPDAYVLIVNNAVNAVLNEIHADHDELFNEQLLLPYDRKAFMRGRVVNKHARWNICFSDFTQLPDYENKKGTIINFDDVPLTKYIKEKIEIITESVLQGEGNYYYDTSKTGIGFHGDSERKKIIAVKLGEIIPFEYQYYYQGEPVGERIHLQSGNGDIYVMDEVSSGFNWKRRKVYTLRHAVGCKKYLK